MAALLNQRELLATLKQEILFNLEVLHSIHPIPLELYRHLFKEDALEKPSQNVFLYMCYYLNRVISPKNLLPWPLYDTNTERAFKKELASIVVQYQSTGLVSPVMASYFVNPGCFKVIKLMLQLSQLAIQTVLQQKLKKDSQKQLFNDKLEKFKGNEFENFSETSDIVRDVFRKKIYGHINYKKKMEAIATDLKKQIVENETECKIIQEKINIFVDLYLESCPAQISGIEAIKNISEPSIFFKTWLIDLDKELDAIEQKWNTEVTEKLLKTSQNCFQMTKSLLARYSGECDPKTYTLEYDPIKDVIDTSNLEVPCTTQQKSILKNIIRDEKLNFPFLVRGFFISICHMLKNVEIGDDIYNISEFMSKYTRDMGEAVSGGRVLMSKLISTDVNLQPLKFDMSMEQVADIEDILFAIPPLPDLTFNEEQLPIFDSFTPLNVGKRSFSIRRKYSLSSVKQPRALLNAGPREDFLKTIVSCRLTAYNSSIIQNTSIYPCPPSRLNETVSDCSTGFSKKQITRLLSTKKKSSTKKKKEREDVNVKVRGNLFDASVESISLFRSHSSPNLFENKDRRSGKRYKGTDLSTMQENSPCFSELSGITALDCNSKIITSNNSSFVNLTPKNVILNKTPEIVIDEFEDKNNFVPEKVTPNIVKPARKSSSIEKIISRYKRIRATVKSNVIKEDFSEKENVATDYFVSSKNSLPDLLSPSCSVISKSGETDWQMFSASDDLVCNKRPRESLGAVLGVDNTFLDQFDFID